MSGKPRTEGETVIFRRRRIGEDEQRGNISKAQR